MKYQFDQWVPQSALPLPTGYYGHLHNVYLQYAAERGLPTLLIFLWLIAKILWDFARALRRKLASAEARFVLHGAIAVIIAILAEGFAEYNLGDSEVLTMFLAVVAFGYVAVEPGDTRNTGNTRNCGRFLEFRLPWQPWIPADAVLGVRNSGRVSGPYCIGP